MYIKKSNIAPQKKMLNFHYYTNPGLADSYSMLISLWKLLSFLFPVLMLLIIIIDECNTVPARKSSRAASLLVDAVKVFPHLASKCGKFVSWKYSDASTELIKK